MNSASDFTSNFWNIYVVVIVVASLVWLIWLLVSQNKVKREASVELTGHSWDGIEEWNNPLPRWWFFLFWITVIFAVVYLTLYPGLGTFQGVLGWTSHGQYEEEMKQAEAEFAPKYARFQGMSIPRISLDAEAKDMGRNLFQTYCIQCHGSDAKGTRGFPNLTDKDWLWGGDPETIMETISDGRMATMLPYGGLPPFPETSVRDVMNYIFSLSEVPETKAKANPEAAAKGKEIFDSICFTCHQSDGKGMLGMAPNLTDGIWLWGGREDQIMNTIMYGHNNQMPSWRNFLVFTNAQGKEDDTKLKVLAAYVWGLSNPTEADVKAYEEKAAAEGNGEAPAEEAPAAEAPAAEAAPASEAEAAPAEAAPAAEAEAAPAAEAAVDASEPAEAPAPAEAQ